MRGRDRLTDQPFNVDAEQHEEIIIMAIHSMDNKKVVGTDAAQVEMAKANAGKVSKLLTAMWRVVGYSTVVPSEWLEGITVPLFKGKGSQADPAN